MLGLVAVSGLVSWLVSGQVSVRFCSGFVPVEVFKECDAGRRKSTRWGEKARPASHSLNPTL